MKIEGTDNPHSIFKNSSFKQSLKRMGYAQTIEGFEKCLKKEIKIYSLSKLSKELNISDWALRTWMDKFNTISIDKPIFEYQNTGLFQFTLFGGRLGQFSTSPQACKAGGETSSA